MTENEKFINFLTKLNIEILPQFKEGKLIKRDLNIDDTWIIEISFPQIIPSFIITKLIENIKRQLLTLIGGVECFVKIHYDSLFNIGAYLNEYFNTTINIIKNKKMEVSVLEHYPRSIDNNLITIRVPNDSEKNIVMSCFKYINRVLADFGLNNVKLDAVIDDKTADVQKTHIEEIKNEESSIAAKTYETYQKRKVTMENSNVMNEFIPNKRNDAAEIKFCDIPIDEYSLNEYKQLNGGDLVSLHGVIVSSTIEDKYSEKNKKSFKIFSAYVTDRTDTILVKRFFNDERDGSIFINDIKEGIKVDILGRLQWDKFAKQVVVMINKIATLGQDTYRIKFDGQDEKRIELHAHTKMTSLDSVLNYDEYVEQAARFGHPACAVTDYENCHILPDFFSKCNKEGIKPIAGLELNYIDEDDLKIAFTDEDIPLADATFTIFDIETTGLCINLHEIIEIGAVKIKNGQVVDEFSAFVKPKVPISRYITNLTEISNDQVYSALTIEEVLPEFADFISGTILVAHNARFDTDFIYENMKRIGIFEKEYPCIDTLLLARAFAEKLGLKKFALGPLGKALKVEVEQQHRAIHDSRTLRNIFLQFLGELSNSNITNYNQLNSLIDLNEIYKYVIPSHINMLVKNKVGLKNMYKLLSDAQTTHYAKGPRLLTSVLEEYREGLLIGSGDYTGEICKMAFEKTEAHLRKKIKYYDYIEVQAPSYYKFLFEHTEDKNQDEYIRDTLKMIIRVAQEEGKIVVATGDVHELIADDREYRKIYLRSPRVNGSGRHELYEYENIPDCHFKTTTEMLMDFDFLPGDLAREIVIYNTQKINNMIDHYNLFTKDMYVPNDNFLQDRGIPSMEHAMRELCYENCHKMYGPNIPQYVQDRLDRELDAIIGHGYFSVYYISHLLVKNSNDNGYVVGSRGSVGSSFVATMMNITEVNSLVAHYLCPNCYFTAFKFDESLNQKYPQTYVPDYILSLLDTAEIGLDLPECNCPKCSAKMKRLGYNIAFETFLGFTGEKCPDIDLNFSGEYQAQAHLFIQNMFGKNFAYRAGTTTTVQEKTAAGFVRGYYEEKNIYKRDGEITRIARFIEGSKRTNGQHPGGIVVVPNYMEIYDITPIQFPPVSDNDDTSTLNWRTSHYDYHSFESNLLKLDILGHDDPTMMKKLIGYVRENPDIFDFTEVEDIPLTDEEVLSLFSSKDALHLMGDDGDSHVSGTIGMPEFGTETVRRMLDTIRPRTFNDIIKVSGLSHGTDVWFSNAESLVNGGIDELNHIKVPFSQVIGCRDDIMNYLINCGVEASVAFKIMESVRKGRGLSDDQVAAMKEKGVPEWYIWTCRKIKYLFPKAHATAYCIMALRIGWFKVHFPIFYYAVYFSVRCKEFDPEVFAAGKNAIRNRINDITTRISKREEVKDKEKALLDELYIAYEMVLRGFRFEQINLEKSLATDFVITEDKRGLYLPFVSLDSLGLAAAESVVEERNKRPFTSKEDLKNRTKLTKTHISKLSALGVLDDLPDDDMKTLF